MPPRIDNRCTNVYRLRAPEIPSHAIRSIVESMHLSREIGDIGTFFLPKCAPINSSKEEKVSLNKVKIAGTFTLPQAFNLT